MSYPIFLTTLDERPSVVVGTGPAAERKVQGLIDADAQVTLIDPNPNPVFRQWADEGLIEWIDRSYRPGDLEGAVLAFVTDVDDETKRQVWEEAQERNVLINTTGDEERSTFANGSCLRRGPLVVSVSTSGAAPTLSVRLREEFEETIGPEYEALLRIMNALRDPMQTHVSDFRERRERWYALVDSDVLPMIRENRVADARDRIESIVGSEVVNQAEATSGTLLDGVKRT